MSSELVASPWTSTRTMIWGRRKSFKKSGTWDERRGSKTKAAYLED